MGKKNLKDIHRGLNCHLALNERGTEVEVLEISKHLQQLGKAKITFLIRRSTVYSNWSILAFFRSLET